MFNVRKSKFVDLEHGSSLIAWSYCQRTNYYRPHVGVPPIFCYGTQSDWPPRPLPNTPPILCALTLSHNYDLATRDVQLYIALAAGSNLCCIWLEQTMWLWCHNSLPVKPNGGFSIHYIYVNLIYMATTDLSLSAVSIGSYWRQDKAVLNFSKNACKCPRFDRNNYGIIKCPSLCRYIEKPEKMYLMEWFLCVVVLVRLFSLFIF